MPIFVGVYDDQRHPLLLQTIDMIGAKWPVALLTYSNGFSMSALNSILTPPCVNSQLPQLRNNYRICAHEWVNVSMHVCVNSVISTLGPFQRDYISCYRPGFQSLLTLLIPIWTLQGRKCQNHLSKLPMQPRNVGLHISLISLGGAKKQPGGTVIGYQDTKCPSLLPCALIWSYL